MCLILLLLCSMCEGFHIGISPSSTILRAGTTTVTINVTTDAACECRWAADHRPYAQMKPLDGNGMTHTGEVGPVCGGDSTLPSNITVRCSVWEEESSTVQYRCLSSSVSNDTLASYPRYGNLWGFSNFRKKGIKYAASRVDLWLGAAWPASEIRQLRQLNKATAVLGSINAVEYGDGLPERFYLHNVSGQAKKDRCETWPGSYRLDLTKSEVSQWQATRAYNVVLCGGGEGNPNNCTQGDAPLALDGLFVDNVFLTQSWQKTDIHGNPFYPDPDGTGHPMDPKEFDAQWRAGVLLELQTFRDLMPFALLSGHAMDPHDPAIAALFNAISIGFDMPEVVEGLRSFDEAWARYQSWMAPAVVHTPHVTMIESAIRLQFGYGYGFDDALSKGSIPASTLMFARQEYRYMRFGLAFTLMRNGYFTHEVGDSWHGQDWMYDELAYDLGHPLGPARFVANTTVKLSPSNWSLWVDPSASASLAWEDDAPYGKAAHVTIKEAPTRTDGVDLHHDGVALTANQRYVVSFRARGSSSSSTVVLNMRRDVPDWHNFGLDATVSVGSEWGSHQVAFTATMEAPETSVRDARLSFFLSAADTFIDDVSIASAPAAIAVRPYSCGLAIVNGGADRHCVDLAALPSPASGPYARLSGAQAPMDQFDVDDDDGAAFSASPPDAWKLRHFAGGYDFSRPTEEVDKGPYYHHWKKGCRVSGTGSAASNASAVWKFSVSEADSYAIKSWWARAPEGKTWSTRAAFDILDVHGKVLASKVLDQTTGGDEWNTVGVNITLAPPEAAVRLTCPTASHGAPCVADAIFVESSRRYNDGKRTEQACVRGFDGLVLRRDVPEC